MQTAGEIKGFNYKQEYFNIFKKQLEDTHGAKVIEEASKKVLAEENLFLEGGFEESTSLVSD